MILAAASASKGAGMVPAAQDKGQRDNDGKAGNRTGGQDVA